jgi:hypothetical protein
MTSDIESIRRMVTGCDGDGKGLRRYDDAQILFSLSQLLREVDRLWSKYPAEADHTWNGTE